MVELLGGGLGWKGGMVLVLVFGLVLVLVLCLVVGFVLEVVFQNMHISIHMEASRKTIRSDSARRPCPRHAATLARRHAGLQCCHACSTPPGAGLGDGDGW